MAFLRGLGVPCMTVRGNHDIPLFNILARVLTPFGSYRAHVTGDLTPVAAAGHVRLYGMNTADPLSRRGGVARAGEIDHICRAMQDGRQDVINILVCHHPLEEPPGFERGETKGAPAALARLAAAGLHVTLSGHLHHWQTGLGIACGAGCAVFQMQSGSALCARTHERDHGFAVMDFDAGRVSVTPRIYTDAARQFKAAPLARFSRADGLWHRLA